MGLNIKRLIGAAAAIAAMALTSAAQGLTAQKAFVDAPQEVFPLLDKTARLDMVDYFQNGMETGSSNRINGKSRITAMTPQSINVEMTAASNYQLALIPMGGDSLVAVITTVKSPAPDSRLDFFNSRWEHQPEGVYFVKPTMTDWLTPEGRKNNDDVTTFVPFLLISYAFDPATGTLTLTNNTKQFLSADVYDMVSPYLKPQLIYKWNGKKFVAS